MGDFDYQKLDDVIHSRMRLAIMSVLMTVTEADFNFLKKQVNATDGNLSISLKKLEESGYVSVTKSFIDRKPSSKYQLTPEGRTAFSVYLGQLEKLLGKQTPD
ncbi:MAG: transcriptional regulator [Bacteroidetes bacterium]|nr:transcriptional regulator [Bacteroidota bacterium]